MPNWCCNRLTLTGYAEFLNKFNENNLDDEKNLDFSKSVPFPEDKYANKEWLSWRILNWGTKWIAVDTIISMNLLENDSTSTIIYEFSTAWAQPSEWIMKTAKLYPAIEFELKYFEQNYDISGILKIKNNDIINMCEGKCGEYFGIENDDVD